MLEYEDVLVTAPTGSGKTWIAREEIRRLLAEGKRAWYTTPLKALTNSKYQEFSDEFGAERVGILTGDRKSIATNFSTRCGPELRSTLISWCSTKPTTFPTKSADTCGRRRSF